MKKIITVLLMILPCISMADMSLDIRNQMLDSEIEKYTQIRDEKYAALKQCEKTTKGFKIAGITTLIATGVGVGIDIKLAKDLKKVSQTQDASCDLSKLDAKEVSALSRVRGYYEIESSDLDYEAYADLNQGGWEVSFSFGKIKGESSYDYDEDDKIYSCKCKITNYTHASSAKECVFQNSEWVYTGLGTSNPQENCPDSCADWMMRSDEAEFRKDLYDAAK